MSINGQLELPNPPLLYYPPPPNEPQWSQERQSNHARSLYMYISALVVWVDLCRSEMICVSDMGLPLAPREHWDSFFYYSEAYITDLMRLLKVWASDPMEPDEIIVDTMPAIRARQH